MPKPSWEASNNDWSYGYLKFLDFQTQGFDVHVTFQKDKRVHTSIYELGGKKINPPNNVWLTVQTYGLTITAGKMNLIKTATQSKAWPAVDGFSSYRAFFMENNNAKAVELGIIATKPKPTTTTTPTFTDADFPPLG